MSLQFFRGLFSPNRKESDFKNEIEAHLQIETERLREQGLSREEAHNAAHRAFGNITKSRERFYESTHWLFWDNLWRDIRLAMRVLRSSPSFTIAAIVTLAVAIGANAIVFGALNAVMLRPLNVPQAQSLYALQPRLGDTSLQESYPNYIDLRDRNKSFDGLAGFNTTQVGLDSGQNPSPVWIYEVTANYFDVLQIHPYLGRILHASDEHGANSAPYAVVSYAYWQTHFQSDRTVVGRTVQLNKHPFTIIGVTPHGFHGTLLFFSPEFFVPMVDEEQLEGTNNLNARGNPSMFFGAMGHLKQGVSQAAAVADLNSIGAYLNNTYPKLERPYSFSLKRPSLYGDFIARPMRAFLTALMLLAGLILLAACTNLGSLFAARAADRSREIALRLALGASRLRVMRQLFTEAILVSLIGGGIGLWGSLLLLQRLSTWQPFPLYPINLPVSPDAKVYLLALLLALASGLLFGVAPVWQVMRTDPYQVVKSGSTAKAGRRITARELLLGAQIAICAVLVTASFVAVRGLARSLHGNFGFEPRNTMLVGTDLDMAGYSGQTAPAMQKRMIQAIESIPGVKTAGLIDWVPLGGEGWKQQNVFTDKTPDLQPSKAAADATMLKISPGYFSAASTRLLTGRDVMWNDDKSAPRVALVNQEFAREVFGSVRSAVGGYYKLQDGKRIEVVGIVEDGKFNSLTEDPQSAMFLPLLQWPSSGSEMVVRSERDPHDLAIAIRSRLRDLDPGLPSFIETWTKAMDLVLFPARVATVALGILGLMGVILSVTGIFGMAAYSVSKRKRELGIRIALGAQRKEVLRTALGHAIRLLAFGSVAGLSLGILASRVLSSVVYQATPRDPVVLVGVVLAMTAVGLVATWIPAHRALAIDPVTLLREE